MSLLMYENNIIIVLINYITTVLIIDPRFNLLSKSDNPVSKPTIIQSPR